MASNFHETYAEAAPPLPSDRSTGLVFAGVAAIVAWLWRADPMVHETAVGLGVAFAALSLLAPSLLHPLNVAWMRLAVLLNRVMSPLIMLVLFCIAIVPFGLALQARRDVLRRKRGSGATYWIERQPTAVPSSMRNQF